jgi:tRNA(fMet)-specific endonuclease VapC
LEKLEDSKEICVDTDILIDFLKGKNPGSLSYERWRSTASIGVTSITAFELLMGARGTKSSSPKRYEEAKSFIEAQKHVFPFDQESADKASEIGAELILKGRGIEIRDLFNASICIVRGLPLLTRNKDHYQRVSSLKLLDV